MFNILPHGKYISYTAQVKEWGNSQGIRLSEERSGDETLASRRKPALLDLSIRNYKTIDQLPISEMIDVSDAIWIGNLKTVFNQIRD